MKLLFSKLIFILALTGASVLLITSCTTYYPPHNHTDTYYTSENTIEPTCVSGGRYDKVKYCSDCQAEIDRETIYLPNSAHIAHHNACITCGQPASIGLEYKINDDKTYTVVGLGSCTDNQIIVPTTYNGYPVSKIDTRAFFGYMNITTVSLQSEIEQIGDHAFEECQNLSSVYINSNVTGLTFGTFGGCVSLDNITLPSTLKGFYTGNIFYGCDALRKVDFLGTVEQWCNIYFGADNPTCYTGDLYINGNLLTDLVLSEGIEKISNSAFINLKSLKTVILPNSLKEIGYNNFRDCPNIVCSQYDNGLYIGNNTNEYLVLLKAKSNSISSCAINPSTQIICSDAFYQCNKLSSITIPDSVRFIGNHSFGYCTSLKEIEIPESVEYIDNYAFTDSGLKKVIFKATNCQHACCIFSGVGYDNGGLDVVIGSNVSIIPDYIFAHSGGSSEPANINSLTFEPNSKLKKVGYCAFRNCPATFDVYYNDPEETWSDIIIESGNKMLTTSTFHFK